MPNFDISSFLFLLNFIPIQRSTLSKTTQNSIRFHAVLFSSVEFCVKLQSVHPASESSGSCNRITSKTAARSPLRNRGYERSEHPRLLGDRVTSTLNGSPCAIDGAPLQGASLFASHPQVVPTYGYGAETLSASW